MYVVHPRKSVILKEKATSEEGVVHDQAVDQRPEFLSFRPVVSTDDVANISNR